MMLGNSERPCRTCTLKLPNLRDSGAGVFILHHHPASRQRRAALKGLDSLCIYTLPTTCTDKVSHCWQVDKVLRQWLRCWELEVSLAGLKWSELRAPGQSRDGLCPHNDDETSRWKRDTMCHSLWEETYMEMIKYREEAVCVKEALCLCLPVRTMYPTGLELSWPWPVIHFISHRFLLCRSPGWALGAFCALVTAPWIWEYVFIVSNPPPAAPCASQPGSLVWGDPLIAASRIPQQPWSNASAKPASRKRQLHCLRSYPTIFQFNYGMWFLGRRANETGFLHFVLLITESQ